MKPIEGECVQNSGQNQQLIAIQVDTVKRLGLLEKLYNDQVRAKNSDDEFPVFTVQLQPDRTPQTLRSILGLLGVRTDNHDDKTALRQLSIENISGLCFVLRWDSKRWQNRGSLFFIKPDLARLASIESVWNGSNFISNLELEATQMLVRNLTDPRYPYFRARVLNECAYLFEGKIPFC